MKVTYDLNDDAPRYVIEALTKVGRPLDIDDLATNYIPPTPNNLADIRAGLRDSSRNPSNDEARYHLIDTAIVEINRLNYDDFDCGDVLVEGDYGCWQLVDGVDVHKLVWRRGEPLVQKSPSPLTSNIRTPNPKGYRELTESMKQYGWLPELPAIRCKCTEVIVVGNRRMKVAEDLRIEPVVSDVDFGEGPAAEARKLRLAMVSNIGGEKLSAADRREWARKLYDDDNLTQAQIAELLNVTAMTISRDLRGFNIVKTETRGRPRKKKAEPRPEPAPPAPNLTLVPGGVTEDTPGMTPAVEKALADAKAKATPAAQQGEEPDQEPVEDVSDIDAMVDQAPTDARTAPASQQEEPKPVPEWSAAEKVAKFRLFWNGPEDEEEPEEDEEEPEEVDISGDNSEFYWTARHVKGLFDGGLLRYKLIPGTGRKREPDERPYYDLIIDAVIMHFGVDTVADRLRQHQEMTKKEGK